MPKYTVRHAVLQYPSKNAAGQDTFETAFRNMNVDLPDDASTQRLLDLGAIVPEGEELTRPGNMLALPETATEAEILNWVAGATTAEVSDLVAARPAMAGRLLSAQESIQARFEAQAELLGEAKEKDVVESPSLDVSTDNSGGVTPAPQPSTTPTPAVNSPGDVPNPAVAGQGGLVDGGLSDIDADDVVNKGARAAADYVSEHPEHAQAILAAENRRDEEPRPTVVKAVQAAAQFNTRG